VLTPEMMHGYQNRSVDHGIEHPQSMLHLDPGLGKTVSTLTTIQILKYDMFAVKAVLIAAPLRVVQSVWKQEAKKWSHTQGLTFSYITGDRNSRIRGLCAKADIYLVNYENLVWLQAEVEHRFLSRGMYPPWDMFVADEITKLKGTRVRQGVKRGIAALKLLQYCPRRIGLTGSPAPNGMLDLFGQYLCIDSGKRLGTSHTAFRSMYFYQADYQGNKWLPFEKSKEQISEKIADITVDMRARDYLVMPDEIVNDIMLTLPMGLQAQYDRIEQEMLLELASGNDVEIFNRASLMNRCLQFAGGAVYLNPGAPEFEAIHKVKLDAFVDLVEELNGQPLLVLYQYQHEAKRILKLYPDAKWLSSKTSETDFNQAIMDWNTGKLSMIIAHPASMGHGVDRLQTSCHNICLYGLPWSWELYFQSISRISRQGQSSPTVMIHRLMMTGTVDLLVSAALHLKQSTETEVRDLIKKYGEEKRKLLQSNQEGWL
jgi:hypothetical protein